MLINLIDSTFKMIVSMKSLRKVQVCADPTLTKNGQFPERRQSSIFLVCSAEQGGFAQSWTFLKDFNEKSILKVEVIKLI